MPTGERLAVLAESRLGEGAHYLAHAVGPEVEAQHGVVGAHPSFRADERGGDELIGLTAEVCLAGGRGRVLDVMRGTAVHQQVIRGLGSLPTAVAVHREVAAHHARHPSQAGVGAPTLDGFQVPHAGAGRRVASVGDAVDDELLRAQPCRQLDHGAHVLELRVHATVGAQPQKVHPWSCGQRGAQHVVVGERIARYRVVDPGDRLRHHCSGSQREVAHLRVAHLPIGQPDARPGGAQRAAGAVRPQLVEHGRACQRDRVARTGRGDPPAVQHDQAHAGC